MGIKPEQYWKLQLSTEEVYSKENILYYIPGGMQSDSTTLYIAFNKVLRYY